MANDSIRIAVDGAGKRLDTESLVVDALTVHRERMQIAGAIDAAIAGVLNGDPTGTEYALLARLIEVNDPQSSQGTQVAVVAGVSADVDSTSIPNGKTGKLVQAVASSSVPIKAELVTVVDSVETVRAVSFTGPGKREVVFTPPSKEFWTVPGDAVTTDAFRLKITNLDTSETADLYGFFLWDEV